MMIMVAPPRPINRNWVCRWIDEDDGRREEGGDLPNNSVEVIPLAANTVGCDYTEIGHHHYTSYAGPSSFLAAT